MAITKKQEERALSADEKELVGMSAVRASRSLTDAELTRLVKRLRTKRDRAKTVAERQRRELRGKARPRGATPAKDDDGSQLKLMILSAALIRLDTETGRREQAKAKASLVASAKKALALKQKAKPAKAKAKAKTASKAAKGGLRGKARVVVENHVPASVRGSVRKQNARVQARRDAR
ncbi:MAG: hypothetical protein FD144_3929 [Rhodospirillaceae bacterium]|nr:MAG: hypothetical protein FD144_3929 [Rhodospirillaceae bacterium]